MEAGAIRPGYELWRPNREKPESKSARALVVFLLLVTAALAFVIIIGGWTRLEGVKALTIVYAALYVLFAFLVVRWNRGVLPVAAALSIILAIFAGNRRPGLVRPCQGRPQQPGAAPRPARHPLPAAGARSR